MIDQSTIGDAERARPGGQRGSGRRREDLLVLVSMVAGAALVLGALVGFAWLRSPEREQVAAATGPADRSTGDLDEDPQPSTTQPSPTQPTPTQPPADDGAPSTSEPDADDGAPDVELLACPSRYSAEICDAAAFVQETRGRPFKTFPEVELLDDASFDAALLDDVDELRADVTEDERVLKALGLIDPGIDLVAAIESLLEAGVVGFYDPDDGRLVVRGDQLDLYGQSILVHELVHAFDDQWFDLGRDDFETDDAEYGFSAVVEGNASRVEDLWKETLTDEERARLQVEEFGSLSAEDLDRLRALPQVVLNLQASPYRDGQRYVSDLARTGGEDAVDDRLTEPPPSSEQVLHPGSTTGAAVPIDVTTPAPDGSELSQGTLGELLIGNWLGQVAAAGWGGDRYIVYEADGTTCLTVDLAADTETDLVEMAVAVERWVGQSEEQRELGAVETVDRSLLRISGCYQP